MNESRRQFRPEWGNQLIQDVEEIICARHQKTVMLFSLKEDEALENRLLCNRCLEEIDITPTSILWSKAKEKIKTSLNKIIDKMNQEKQDMIGIVKLFKNSFDQFKTAVNQSLDEILTQASLWIACLEQIGNEGWKVNQQSLLEELARNVGLNPQKQQEIEMKGFPNIFLWNYNFKYKLKRCLGKLFLFPDQLRENISQIFTVKEKEIKFQDLLSEIEQVNSKIQTNKQLIENLFEQRKFLDFIIKDFQKDIEKDLTKNSQIQDQVIKANIDLTTQHFEIQKQDVAYQLIDEVEQYEWCYAIAFNKDASLMAAGRNNNISIWQFEKGELKPSSCQLQHGHTGNVWCLVFSKKKNWFASGSKDQTIRCWKELSSNNWVSSQPGIKHTRDINCLLFNNEETMLLSCSDDTTIKVWFVNYDVNELSFSYSLDRHIDWVNCISLNESQRTLVSCGDDKQIIIWGKNWWFSKWDFKYIIQQSGEYKGCRICFINDDMISWQQYSSGITHIFQLENGVFKVKPELSIVLNQLDGDKGLFPSIFHKFRQVHFNCNYLNLKEIQLIDYLRGSIKNSKTIREIKRKLKLLENLEIQTFKIKHQNRKP